MKAVLVIDMPEKCEDCLLEQCDTDSWGYDSNWQCPMFHKGYTGKTRNKARLEECPLKPLPEKKKTPKEQYELYPNSFGKFVGWNDCLKAITGGKDE